MKHLLLLAFCLSTFAASASHLMGGEIVVKEMSPGEYLIHLTTYRDTMGVPAATTQFYDITNSLGVSVYSGTMNVEPSLSGASIPGYPYGVEPYHYFDTVYLTTPDQYNVSWSNCCRNAAIMNLSNPGGESMYLNATFEMFAAASNSTPIFLAPPVIYLPANVLWQYNPIPFDFDGDQLSWSIDVPLNAAGSPCAGYVTPASNVSGPFTIDPVTGILSWNASTQGNFVASILVEEFRNGVKIGEIRRDMQFVVIQTQASMPTFTNIGSVPLNPSGYPQLNLNYNTPFSFIFTATDADVNDVLRVDAFGGMFELPTNPATFTFVHTGTGYNNADATFSWTPDANALPNYALNLRVTDNLFNFDETVLVNVSGPTSIEEQEQFTIASLYPNPSSGQVFLNMNLPKAEQATIEVMDISGRIIQTTPRNLPLGQVLLQMDIDAPAGQYFVRVITASGSVAQMPLILVD